MSSIDAQLSAAKLAAQVAHELNNPLDAVLRFVSLAQRKSQSGNYTDVERHLADAQFGLQRMAESLKQLMDLGRQTHDVLAGLSGRPALPLEELIEQARQSLAAHAEQKRVVVEVDYSVPEHVQPRYAGRLAHVLENLLKNAIEASPEGGIVRVSASQLGDNTLEVVVEDSGPGVGAEVIGQLFMPFVTTKGTGHGLGLAISRELVVGMQGAMTLRNRTAPEHGCVVTVVLPMPIVF